MALTNEQYLGAAGEEAVSTELLRRGYNVGTFKLDEGIDLLVSDSQQDMLSVVQVKTALASRVAQQWVGHYVLNKEQLKKRNRYPFLYVFVLWQTNEFRFVVVPRAELFLLRLQFEQKAKRQAQGEELNLRLFFAPDGTLSGWGQSFASFLGFEKSFPALSHSAR